MKSFKLTLLHVDDNPNDRLQLQTALDSTRTLFNFHGIDGLRGAIEYFGSARTNRPLGHSDPALVLLNYKLGFQRATDFLYWLRVQHRNTAVPVIVYSTSVDEEAVGQCYELGVTHFLIKPQSFSRMKVVAITLRVCFSRLRPDFRFLDGLPEAMLDPRIGAAFAA